MSPKYRESTWTEPGQCQICGCEPNAIPLCEHLLPPTETLGKQEGKTIYCPICPLHKYKWYQFSKKKQQKISKIIPMLNPSENDYKCQFCGYGYRS